MGNSEEYSPLRLSRRRFLGSGLAVAGGAAVAGLSTSVLGSAVSAAAAPAKLKSMTYQLSWVKDAEFAGTFVADTMGFYKKHGLAVNILAGGAAVTPEPVVVSGKALVASSTADAVASAIDQGAPLKIIGARYQKSPYCIISLAGKPINHPTGLYGKKLGCSAADEVAWQAFAKVAKLDVSKIDVVPVQFDPTPLANGEVDAWVGFITSEPGQLEVKGVKVYTFLFADFGYSVYADVYEVTESTLKTKEAELVAFMKAEKQGWTYNFENVPKSTGVAMKYAASSGLALSQQLLENRAQRSLFYTPYTKAHGLFAMSPADIEANVKTLALGKISAKPSMFTDQIVSQI